MQEKSVASSTVEEPSPTKANTSEVSVAQPTSEGKQAYGTAKTENLRDSGLWRMLLPTVVILSCLALLAIPLIILFPLLYQSFNPNLPTGPGPHGVHLTWLWIVMIVIEVTVATVIIRGLVRIFMTQAGNYSR
ncbi:MAG: hypothetical protein E6J34_01945 [Chloroflexi bacterium]|nr:MAG: hypothetical protein E6J34_01945 [Chloroflexota bacterium]